MQPKFQLNSPGFLYSAIVVVLAIFAATGVQFPKDPHELATSIITTLSDSGVYSLIGIIVSSFIFPLWNFWKQGGKITLNRILSSTLVWFAIGNAAVAGIALTGFMLPDGTVDQIIGAAYSRDWGTLIVVIFSNIVNPLIRFLKDKNKAIPAAL